MDKVQIKLMILFDGTFWIGVFDKVVDGKLYVAKYVFESEPRDVEIYNFVLFNYKKLKFDVCLDVEKKKHYSINPKRLQRIVKKQINSSIGTKSQQVLKLQQEANKNFRKQYNRIRKEELKEVKFQIRQKKKLEKHKGR